MPKPLQWLPIYVAEVTETGLGDLGRNIKAANEFLPDTAGEIAPALDGLLKMPPPIVGEKVLILQVDATNLHRYYIPIRSEFAAVTDDPEAAQIESAALLELEGTEIKLGVDAEEPAVLGDTLKTQLEDLITQITSITVVGNIGVPTGPPINAAAISALSSLLVNILSGKVKIE